VIKQGAGGMEQGEKMSGLAWIAGLAGLVR